MDALNLFEGRKSMSFFHRSEFVTIRIERITGLVGISKFCLCCGNPTGFLALEIQLEEKANMRFYSNVE